MVLNASVTDIKCKTKWIILRANRAEFALEWCVNGVVEGWKSTQKEVFLGLKSWNAEVEILWNNEQIALLNRAKCELSASIRCRMKFKRYRNSLVFMLFSRWFFLEWKSCLMLFVKKIALILTSKFHIFRFKPKSLIRSQCFHNFCFCVVSYHLLFSCRHLACLILLTGFATSSKTNRPYAQPLSTN